MRTVTIGTRGERGVEIASGIAAGEQVVVDHVLGLEDGQRARVASRSEVIVRWLRAQRRASCGSPRSRSPALGALSIFALPSGIYPEMTFPRVVVVAHAGQLSPELVEAQITRPLEQALAVVPGVRHVRARTIRGAVELSLQLTDDADPLTRAVRVSAPRSITSSCRAARRRVVERVLPTSVPVITFNLCRGQGRARPIRARLREVAERIVRPALVRVPGVGGVEVQRRPRARGPDR